MEKDNKRLIFILLGMWITTASAIMFSLTIMKAEPDAMCMLVHDDAGIEWRVCNLTYKTGRQIKGEF